MPDVLPHLVQIFGLVQVAALYVCEQVELPADETTSSLEVLELVVLSGSFVLLGLLDEVVPLSFLLGTFEVDELPLFEEPVSPSVSSTSSVEISSSVSIISSSASSMLEETSLSELVVVSLCADVGALELLLSGVAQAQQ